MNRRIAAACLALACLAPAALVAPRVLAQTTPAAQPPQAGAPQSLDLRYTGANARIGIGYDTENKLRGDAFLVLGETPHSAWIGELWLSDRDAGGVKASYHWQPEGDATAGVRKLFAAVDQNRWRDRKVTLGGGYETADWFASGYGSAGISGRRQVGFEETTTQSTQTGSDDTGQWEQDIFTTVTKRLYERAYDGGVGGRIGRFYENVLLRISGGLDYEWGRGGANQATLSIGAEKYFAGSPISIGLVGEAYHKSGDFEPKRDDQRLWVMLRYEFGGPAWRPAREYRQVRVEPSPAVAAAAVATPPPPPAPTTRVERRMVKSTASAASDAFFAFDSAVLRPDAKAALDQVVARIKARGFEGNIRVSGHTCDIGTDAYNQKLSERRAAAVRDYLVAAGIDGSRILAEGMGKREPRYPNTTEGRPKNRRVDIEFVTFEERAEDVTVAVPAAAAPAAAAPKAAPAPAVEWRTEEIVTEPAWLRRALHNPAAHKQAVDVYRSQEVSTTVTQGDKHYVNRPPVAVADSFTVTRNLPATLDVLANDHDPDGDALAITAVGAAAHGSVTISGSKLSYRPVDGYVGSDSFTYTISDPGGLTSSTTVAITVADNNRPPVARMDTATAAFNTPVDINVLANDSDPDGDPLTIVSFTQPTRGIVTRSDHNTLVYLSNKDYIGTDVFRYVISDGRGGTSEALVQVYADP